MLVLKSKLQYRVFKKIKKWDENYLKVVTDFVVSFLMFYNFFGNFMKSFGFWKVSRDFLLNFFIN